MTLNRISARRERASRSPAAISQTLFGVGRSLGNCESVTAFGMTTALVTETATGIAVAGLEILRVSGFSIVGTVGGFSGSATLVGVSRVSTGAGLSVGSGAGFAVTGGS